MKRHNKLILFIIAASVLMLAFPVSADEMTGGGYTIPSNNIGSAGREKESSQNSLNDAIGQSTPAGESSGGGFIMQMGYIFTLALDFEPPVVTVEAPNGGEQYKGGTMIPITWRATDNVTLPQNLSIEVFYSVDGASTWSPIVATFETSTGIGTYEWITPTSINSNEVLIRITAKDISGNLGSDASDTYFAIDSTPPVFSNIVPQVGRYLARNRQYRVKWTAVDEITSVEADSINLYYSPDGSVWTKQNINPIVNNGRYQWAVPNLALTTGGYISIEATDVVGNIGYVSSGPINVIDDLVPPYDAPLVTPEAPMNGEVLLKNSTFVVSWDATDNVYLTTIRLSYNTSGGIGSPWKDVLGAENLDGEITRFAWSVPSNANSTNVVISIEATDQSGNIGYGLTNRFTIEAGDTAAPYDVAIVSAVSGETWLTNTTHTISWTAKDLNSDWTSLSTAISYSTNGGATWTTIISNATLDASGNGTYNWTLPGNIPTSDNCLIKIVVSDPFNNSTTALSDTFKIKGTNTGCRKYQFYKTDDSEINYGCQPFMSSIASFDDLATTMEGSWSSAIGQLQAWDGLYLEIYDNNTKATRYAEYGYDGTGWSKRDEMGPQAINGGDVVLVSVRAGYYTATPRNANFEWGTSGEVPVPAPVYGMLSNSDSEINYLSVPFSMTLTTFDDLAATVEASWAGAAGQLQAWDGLYLEIIDNATKATRYAEYGYDGTGWSKRDEMGDQAISSGDVVIVHVRPGYYVSSPRDVSFNW
jgi:hypothetical protein